MSHQQNIARIKAVHRALGDIAQSVVYVGGATVSLYADRPAGETRPTLDVDIVIELLNYAAYAKLEEKLRAQGFQNDIESGVICRYTIDGIIVDVMPTNDEILGFANPWYPDGYATSIKFDLDNDCSVRIFTAPYFIATKLKAYRDRGKDDARTSSDFEDIVFVLNNRNAIWEEMANAASNLKTYLKAEFGALLDDPYLYDSISAHLDYVEQKRVTTIIGGLTDFWEKA